MSEGLHVIARRVKIAARQAARLKQQRLVETRKRLRAGKTQRAIQRRPK